MFESEDPESTLSGSETRETRPGWPPDDMCADSTRYKGSFDDRDCEGLRLLSPLFQKKVLKLQRDLEEAKAESRYFRARPVDSPVVATNRPRFTTTPCHAMMEYLTGASIARCSRQLCARTDGTR